MADVIYRPVQNDKIFRRGTAFNEDRVIGGAYTNQMCDKKMSSNVNYDTGKYG